MEKQLKKKKNPKKCLHFSNQDHAKGGKTTEAWWWKNGWSKDWTKYTGYKVRVSWAVRVGWAAGKDSLSRVTILKTINSRWKPFPLKIDNFFGRKIDGKKTRAVGHVRQELY